MNGPWKHPKSVPVVILACSGVMSETCIALLQMFTFGGVDKTQYRFPDLHECAKGERGRVRKASGAELLCNCIHTSS